MSDKLGFLEYVGINNGFFEASFHPKLLSAIAAVLILFEERWFMLIPILGKYQDLIEVGSLDIGDCGEFVARLVLLIGKMLASPIKTEYSSVPFLEPVFRVTLKDLLGSLSPLFEDILAEKVYKRPKLEKPVESDMDEFSDVVISFKHFIKIEFLESDNLQKVLQQAFYRGSTIIMPDNNYGVDLLIPFLS